MREPARPLHRGWWSSSRFGKGRRGAGAPRVIRVKGREGDEDEQSAQPKARPVPPSLPCGRFRIAPVVYLLGLHFETRRHLPGFGLLGSGSELPGERRTK